MALKELAAKRDGRTMKGVTMATIINPDTRTADVYRFNGFHLRIAWANAEKGYVGSYKY
jgi:hypothetical protein